MMMWLMMMEAVTYKYMKENNKKITRYMVIYHVSVAMNGMGKGIKE